MYEEIIDFEDDLKVSEDVTPMLNFSIKLKSKKKINRRMKKRLKKNMKKSCNKIYKISYCGVNHKHK